MKQNLKRRLRNALRKVKDAMDRLGTPQRQPVPVRVPVRVPDRRYRNY